MSQGRVPLSQPKVRKILDTTKVPSPRKPGPGAAQPTPKVRKILDTTSEVDTGRPHSVTHLLPERRSDCYGDFAKGFTLRMDLKRLSKLNIARRNSDTSPQILGLYCLLVDR